MKFQTRARAAALIAGLFVANALSWAWAVTAFRPYPLLLGTALLAWGLGLRHAVDADHIAAIDNATRKLMQGGKRPVAVGFFFSIGHSTIVILASLLIAATAAAARTRLSAFRAVGGLIGTAVSSAFLLAIAAMNLVILAGVYRAFRRVRAGGPLVEEDLDTLLAGRGLVARVFRPLFGLIRSSWHMYPLGLLFGLGFDTATEIGLLGIAAAEGASGLPIWNILVYPALFTAGMSLLDTLDSILMLGAYGWAFVKPIRKLYYNLTITFVSVLTALVVGGIEALGLLAVRFSLTGAFWRIVTDLSGNVGSLGFVIIGVFVVTWGSAAVIFRWKRLDEVAIPAAEPLTSTIAYDG